MNFRTLGQSDRKVFESAADRIGSFKVASLQKRMVDGLWQSNSSGAEDCLEKLYRSVNPQTAQQAGCRELVPIFGELPFPLKRLVTRVFSGKAPNMSTRVACRDPNSPRIVLSLRSILDPAEGMPVTQLFLAGLHRLARGVADLDPSCLQRVPANIPTQFLRHFVAAFHRLNKIREARIQAPGIRKEWMEGR